MTTEEFNSNRPETHRANTPDKPIDRWLGLAGTMVGVVLFLLPKTPLVVVVCVALVFLLLIHPIWNFWWIEQSSGRRLIACLLWAFGCGTVGYVAWPQPNIPATAQPLTRVPTPGEIADELERRSGQKKSEQPKLRMSGGKPHNAANLEVELAPYVLLKRRDDRLLGRGTTYGLAVLMRVRSTSDRANTIQALEIVGEIDVSCSDYVNRSTREGVDQNTLEKNCGKKPFQRLSWIAWPTSNSHIEARGEHFIRFVVTDPDQFNRFYYVGDATGIDYFGFRVGDIEPHFTTTVPDLLTIVRFLGSAPSPIVPKEREFRKPQLKEQFFSGELAFRARHNTGRVTIKPERLQPARWTMDTEWARASPQDLFYGAGVWERATPVQKDSLMALPTQP